MVLQQIPIHNVVYRSKSGRHFGRQGNAEHKIMEDAGLVKLDTLRAGIPVETSQNSIRNTAK